MPSQATRRILVIDHNPSVRNLVCGLLEQRGLDCDQAASLDEAIILLREREFDLVLLDLMLPDENGFKALDYLNAEFPRYVDRIIITSSGEKRFLDRVPPTGWCAILTKPFQIAELLRIVELCLGDSTAADVTN